MKRMISFVCTLALLLSFAALPCKAAGNLKEISQNSPFQLTVLGDSIAAGYGLVGYDIKNEPCYECASYANILAEKYGLVAGSSYFNDAASGATTADLLKLLENADLKSHLSKSDTILISIGGNDLLHVLWSAIGVDDTAVTEDDSAESFSIDAAKLLAALSTLDDSIDAALEGFESNFDSVIAQIRNINPNALVIISTVYDPFQGSEKLKPLTEISSDALDRLNTIIKEKATDSSGKVRYTVVDVAAEFKGKEAELTNIGSMDIHPNADGHEAIAQLLDTEISSHTFSMWVLDTSASESKLSDEEIQEKKQFATVMTGLLFMLIIMITVLFLHSMNKLKNQ